MSPRSDVQTIEDALDDDAFVADVAARYRDPTEEAARIMVARCLEPVEWARIAADPLLIVVEVPAPAWVDPIALAWKARAELAEGEGTPPDSARRRTEPLAYTRDGNTSPSGRALKRDINEHKAGRLSRRMVDRGVLLEGVPGTEKTSFVRALAADCGIPLVATSYAS